MGTREETEHAFRSGHPGRGQLLPSPAPRAGPSLGRGANLLSTDTRKCVILNPQGSSGPQGLPCASMCMRSSWSPTSREWVLLQTFQGSEIIRNRNQLLTLSSSLRGRLAGSVGGARDS